MKLYGVSGTNGSGKDSLCGYLARKYNFLFISVSDMLREEAERRALPAAREHLREISAEWRRDGGMGVLVDKALEVYREEGGEVAYAGLVVASLRNPGEADRVHELGGTMIWVDADPKVRYERISAGNRGRTHEDDKTYEQFLAEEAAEMQRSGDAATLSMADVKERCDMNIYNDADNLEAFERLIDDQLGLADA